MSSFAGRSQLVTHDLLTRIAATAAGAPRRVAVTQGSVTIDYATLSCDVERIAAHLASRGIQAGDLVGVHAGRSPSLLSVLLGIWRAGAAWLPLDPGLPDRRLGLMCGDAAVTHVITESEVPWLPEGTMRHHMASLFAGCLELPGRRCPVDAASLPADRLAYVIYTSGSTGQPKGVEVTHGALANLLQAMQEDLELTERDVLLSVTTFSFDISMLEFWGPLGVGGRVEIAPESEQLAPGLLAARLASSGATIMQATPVTWRMLLESGWTGRLRSILCGGERFPLDLVASLLARADSVWNLYGPTETTVWSTAARLTASPRGPRVSVGLPIANTRLYLMGEDGEPVAEGTVGELWIAGAGVARGYRHRPHLTDAAFVPEPNHGGGRAYRTGDLARRAADGSLDLLGRIDEQMKLHGYRIEPIEVEAALMAQPGISQAVVALAGPESDRRLVAHVVPDRSVSNRPTPRELRDALRLVLPVYMVPALVLELDGLPLTANQKVDRRALPDPFRCCSLPEAACDDAPQSERELLLARAWCEVLGREHVRRDDNFFELGGHSFLALRVAEQVRREAGVALDVRMLFFRSLAQVADALT